MKIISIHIYNFRSIKDSCISFSDFTIMVGKNNAGKSNILKALLAFYDYDKGKFDEKLDCYKDNNTGETWVQLEYELNEGEKNDFSKYINNDNKIKIRRYFKSSKKNRVKANNCNLYLVNGEELEKEPFSKIKKVSDMPLGNIIYVPAITNSNDYLDNTKKTSPVTMLIKRIIDEFSKEEDPFSNLESAFKDFSHKITTSGQIKTSLDKFIDTFNNAIQDWDLHADFKVKKFNKIDICEKYIQLKFDQNFDSLGDGVQRNIIYEFIKILSAFSTAKDSTDLSLNILIFDEPESLLHPGQQTILNDRLIKLSEHSDWQTIISSHSPFFISKNLRNIQNIIKISKISDKTCSYKISKIDLDALVNENTHLYQKFSEALNDSEVSDATKNSIKQKGLGDESPELEEKLILEKFKSFLFLDAERTSMFFSDKVLICEGASEKILFEKLFHEHWNDLLYEDIYILDAMGKYNIHRYMNLLSKFGIHHGVLIDEDTSEIQKIVNDFLQANKNDLTLGLEYVKPNLETFLEITPTKRKDDKPVNILLTLNEKNVSDKALNKLKEIIIKCLQLSQTEIQSK